MSKEYVVAVVGATGAVGEEMMKTLEKNKFPVKELIPLASKRSEGKTVLFKGKKIPVKVLNEDSFKGIDIALFSAGGSISKQYAPFAIEEGTIVIDNTSAFRYEKDIPLVVPEVNAEDIKQHKGIIANPNCSTIQMVVALAPIHREFTIKRILVSTYQSVSGAGRKAIFSLQNEAKQHLNHEEVEQGSLSHQIAFNLIPHIDVFMDNGYTKEEMKMDWETKKILHSDDIAVSATCVRVPVFRAHSEAVNVETEKPITAAKVKELLSKAPLVVLQDDPHENLYPMPIKAENKNEVFVGRIRQDESIKNGINMWVVSDNLLKGAAFNAVQIAEKLIEFKLV
ncbi:MAG: aspartate-semialdehyde dehydrogenase [Candidatus Aureabacteria bacterium]|nr:aspartate-semialdehyde dehydrogenase [Candidatus Auribacterota bacterium]